MRKAAVILAVLMGSLSVWGQTITVWIGYPELEPIYRAAAADFEASHPGVKVEISSFNLRDSEAKLSMALAAGTGPDVFNLSIPSLLLQFRDMGALSPMPQKARAWLEASTPKWVQEYVALDLQFYGLPGHQGTKRLYWNKDMFEEVGLQGPPRNWSELIADAILLTKYDENGNVIRSGHSFRLSGGGSGVTQKWFIFLVAAGGQLLEQVGDKYRAGYNNQAGFDTMRLYLDSLHRYHIDSPEIKHDAEAFALERTAMFVRESWVIGYMAQHAPNVNYGVAQLPRYVRSAEITGLDVLCVSAFSKNQDLAWEYALTYVQPKFQRMMLREVGWIPVNTAADYYDIITATPQYEAFLTTPDWEDHVILQQFLGLVPENEIHTRLAERLEQAFLQENLAYDDEALWQWLEEASAETNQILAEYGLYAEKR
ncbi:extracellular solute-binding protein [candidate division WOR-3 bacterium]|nr:extracellular solute-binding protein [candidate division WOR-3 bacterium]